MKSVYRLVRRAAGAVIPAGCFRLIAALAVCRRHAPSAETPHIEGQAPPGQAALTKTRGGLLLCGYVAQAGVRPCALPGADLAGRSRLRRRVGGAEVLREVGDLQVKLRQLRKEIEQKKVARLDRARSTSKVKRALSTSVPNGSCTSGPPTSASKGGTVPVKCVLEKRDCTRGRLGRGNLQAIRLQHRHGLAPELVGKTPAENEADEQKFLAGPEGRKLNPQQRESRSN